MYEGTWDIHVPHLPLRDHLGGDRVVVQMSAVAWDHLSSVPQVKKELLARTEGGTPWGVAGFAEAYIRSLYEQEKICEPLWGRAYSGIVDGRQVYFMEGEADPVPAVWLARRRLRDERHMALDERAKRKRADWDVLEW